MIYIAIEGLTCIIGIATTICYNVIYDTVHEDSIVLKPSLI